MTECTITLEVNGRLRKTTLPARTMLGDLLRDRLNLTGTHLGCEHGVCGACTVLVDGEPVRACITLAASCEGSSITTVEGLTGPLADGLRAAFAAEHALQCGFCTPGMLITATDIIRRMPGADSAAIRAALNGNLCRCTGYVGIVNAIVRAASGGAT
jgi:carbon-monoxide dehydrogenase small subunit